MKYAVELHGFGGALQGPERWSSVDCAEGVELKEEGGDDTEIAAAPTDGPEEFLVLFQTHRHKASIGQHHIRRE